MRIRKQRLVTADQTRQHQQMASQHAQLEPSIMLTFMQVAVKLIGICHQKTNSTRCVNGNEVMLGYLMPQCAQLAL
jgi:hypothetical protein